MAHADKEYNGGYDLNTRGQFLLGRINTMKYKLTGEAITYAGTRLYRIMALHDFGDVREGDLGGLLKGMIT